MRANPGGLIAPSEIVGRDALLARIWRVLERQSVLLTSERRMGKTCVLRKMKEDPPPHVLCMYQDLEGIQTPLEFAETVLRDVEQHLGRMSRVAVRARRLVGRLAGVEITKLVKLPDSMAAHWKSLLTSTMEDLVASQKRTASFFWDEFPLMLHNIKRRSNEAEAMEVLDVCRSLRQTQPGIRMVLTGSIGLHHVVASLRRAGHANDATNDMEVVEVSPLVAEEARKLALLLFEGERIVSPDLEEMAMGVASGVDGVPYLVHHVVDRLARSNGRTVRDVEDAIAACLTDPQDPWHLRYYRERIDTYYQVEHRAMALSLLDVLALAESPLIFEELFEKLKARVIVQEVEPVLEVLTLLQRDHYVVQEPGGAFRFALPLMRRSWRLQRGL